MARSSIHINASAQSVFAYVSDLTKHGEWAGHKLSIEPEQPGPVRVGARYRSHGAQMGRSIEDTLVVTSYEPDRLFVFESQGISGIWRHSYELQPDRDGVELRRTMEPAKLPIHLKILSPLFNIGLRRNQQDLVRLKARVEGQSAERAA